MTISPVTPKDLEQLVPTTTAIIFDATESITTVEVNNVVIWSGGAPQNGWLGYTVVHPAGTRYIFDPPSAFSVGDLKTVEVYGSSTTLVYKFVVGLRQITFTDDASVPRVVETSGNPWIGYSRTPGNIYIRKDDPLTSEVLVVPGDNVDVGYNDIGDEIEILYIQNGKVFIVSGAASETPSTLTQPSILKSNFKSGDTGESPNHRHDVTTFLPIKQAVPTDGPVVTGETGESPNFAFNSPPTSAPPVAFLGVPAVIVVPPASSTLITAVRLFKLNGGAAIQLAEFPYSTEIQVFPDPAYVVGDRYYTQSIYGDQGAPAMRRLTPRSADAGATNGDFLKAGTTGESPNHTHNTTTFSPLKLAVPPDGLTSGDTGHTGEAAYVRTWYPPAGTMATMAAAVGGHVVISGLTQMGLQHLGLDVTISGAATTSNNGAWPIVEIISSTSVRVIALTAPGADGNNGALTWGVTGPTVVSPASFIARNTLNIGVGA